MKLKATAFFILFTILVISCNTTSNKGAPFAENKIALKKSTNNAKIAILKKKQVDKLQDSVRKFTWYEHRNKVNPDGTQTLGLAAYTETVVKYRRDGVNLLKVQLAKPVKIYQAKKKQGWGYVQFPRLQRLDGGSLVARWNMTEDKYEAKPKYGWKYSKDDGEHWNFNWKNRPPPNAVKAANGDEIYVYRNKIDGAKYLDKLEKASFLTSNLSEKAESEFYRKKDLPSKFQGFYLTRKSKGTKEFEHEFAPVHDEKAIVSLRSGTFNIKAWGDLKLDSDGALVKMVYDTYREKANGELSLSSPSFYRSEDNGHRWIFVGKVPFLKTDIVNFKEGQMQRGVDEASFEILKNGNYVCVMRSSSGAKIAPMYISFSEDKGKTWSRPKPFTNNGVRPRLLQLDNGVLVLSSGRRGVQLRFSADGTGKVWTDPFEIVRYKGLRGQVSCGYTAIESSGDNSFLLVYSDFRNRDKDNNIRKAIMSRKITVDKN